MSKPQYYIFPDIINHHTRYLLEQHIKHNSLLISWHPTPYIRVTAPYTASLYKRKSSPSLFPSLSCSLPNYPDHLGYHIEFLSRYPLKIPFTELLLIN